MSTASVPNMYRGAAVTTPPFFRALDAKTAMRAAFKTVQDAFKKWIQAYIAARSENKNATEADNNILGAQNLTMQAMQLWAIALMDIPAGSSVSFSEVPEARAYSKGKPPAAITPGKLYLPRCNSPQFAPFLHLL